MPSSPFTGWIRFFQSLRQYPRWDASLGWRLTQSFQLVEEGLYQLGKEAAADLSISGLGESWIIQGITDWHHRFAVRVSNNTNAAAVSNGVIMILGDTRKCFAFDRCCSAEDLIGRICSFSISTCSETTSFIELRLAQNPIILEPNFTWFWSLDA